MLKLIPPSIIALILTAFYPIPGTFLLGFLSCLWLFVTIGKREQSAVVRKLQRIIDHEKSEA